MDGFTFLDIAVVLIVVLSAIVAISKGFVDESLSILAWATAAFATLFFSPRVAPMLAGHVGHGWEAAAIAYVGIFLVVLLPMQYVVHRLADNVRNSEIGPLDRTMGGVFGVVRGLAIIGIAYLLFTVFVPVRDQPHWVNSAKLLPLIQRSSDVVASIVPDQRGITHARGREIEAQESKNVTATPSPRPGRNGKHARKTYGTRDREALDRLIQSTGDRQ